MLPPDDATLVGLDDPQPAAMATMARRATRTAKDRVRVRGMEAEPKHVPAAGDNRDKRPFPHLYLSCMLTGMNSSPSPTDAWDPGQYHRFQNERSQPFHDLLGLVEARQPRRVVDFGCGSGELTKVLHDTLQAESTLGIDSSAAMLAEAAAYAGDGLSFAEGDIATPAVEGPLDVVFANAALQWVPDHRAVLARWTELLAPGGELAVQVPANVDHASHRVIAELATQAPFVNAGDGPPPPDAVLSVLKPEEYAELLFELGYREQHVRLQVYGHVLDSVDDVVEWTKGTSLTRMKRHFPPEVYEEFVQAYRRELRAELGDHRPYFYAFKRILFHARR